MPSWVASAASRSWSLLSWAAVMAWRRSSMSVAVTSQASTRSAVPHHGVVQAMPAPLRRRGRAGASPARSPWGLRSPAAAADLHAGKVVGMNERLLAARPVRQVQRLAGERPHGTVVVERRAFGPHHPDLVRHGVEGARAAARRWSGTGRLTPASATPSIGPPAMIVRTLPYIRPLAGSRAPLRAPLTPVGPAARPRRAALTTGGAACMKCGTQQCNHRQEWTRARQGNPGQGRGRRQAAPRGPGGRQAVRLRPEDRDEGRDHGLRPRLRSPAPARRRGGGQGHAGRRAVRLGLAHLLRS